MGNLNFSLELGFFVKKWLRNDENSYRMSINKGVMRGFCAFAACFEGQKAMNCARIQNGKEVEMTRTTDKVMHNATAPSYTGGGYCCRICRTDDSPTEQRTKYEQK